MHVLLRADEWRVVGARGGVGGVADRLRRALVRGLDGVEGQRRAVLAGVVLGEDEGLNEDVRDAFRASGLYHLLAVSGQNVALLAAGVALLAWLLRLSRRAPEVLVLLAIAAYVLAVGWQPSVVRAGVAGALASVAWLTARDRDRWWLFLAGAVRPARLEPVRVARARLPAVVRRGRGDLPGRAAAAARARGLPGSARGSRSSLAVSSVCGLATAPILWLQFDAIPVYSVLANALAAPVVGGLLGLALVAGLLAPVAPSAAYALAWVDGWLAAYLIACAKTVARLPFAQLSSTRALVAVFAAALSVAVFARLRAPRPLRALVLLALCSLVLVAWVARAGPDPPPPPTGLRVTFLDVGQGDGCLVEAPGVRLLVDQGPPDARVADQLRRLGVRRLTALVLTHPQRDHVGGAATSSASCAWGSCSTRDSPRPGPKSRKRCARCVAATCVSSSRVPGNAFRIGRLRVAVLWPDGPGFPGEDPNLRATILLVSYGRVDLLLTADAESPVTLPLDPPPVEILKVAHHGSADAGLPELLERLRPKVAVISVGLGNDYGHPTPSTLSALERAPGLRLYRTDLDGRVVVESDGTRLWVRSER